MYGLGKFPNFPEHLILLSEKKMGMTRHTFWVVVKIKTNSVCKVLRGPLAHREPLDTAVSAPPLPLPLGRAGAGAAPSFAMWLHCRLGGFCSVPPDK